MMMRGRTDGPENYEGRGNNLWQEAPAAFVVAV